MSEFDAKKGNCQSCKKRKPLKMFVYKETHERLVYWLCKKCWKEMEEKQARANDMEKYGYGLYSAIYPPG